MNGSSLREELFEYLHSERRLWVGVVAQAVADAVRSLDQSVKAERDAIQGAREWLTQQSQDFLTVCALADLDPDSVRAFAKQEIGKAIESPSKRRATRHKRGVDQDFGEASGTGGGRRARDSAEIEFSQNQASPPCP